MSSSGRQKFDCIFLYITPLLRSSFFLVSWQPKGSKSPSSLQPALNFSYNIEPRLFKKKQPNKAWLISGHMTNGLLKRGSEDLQWSGCCGGVAHWRKKGDSWRGFQIWRFSSQENACGGNSEDWANAPLGLTSLTKHAKGLCLLLESSLWRQGTLCMLRYTLFLCCVPLISLPLRGGRYGQQQEQLCCVVEVRGMYGS